MVANVVFCLGMISADHDYDTTFYLDLHCRSKYPLTGFQNTNVLRLECGQ